jgi:hypothetical protein
MMVDMKWSLIFQEDFELDIGDTNMSDEQRKEKWDRLSESDKQEIEEKRKGIVEWAVKENEKAWNKIVEEGRNKGGLDGEYPELKAITEETNNRLYELLKEYDLEWDTETKETIN